MIRSLYSCKLKLLSDDAKLEFELSDQSGVCMLSFETGMSQNTKRVPNLCFVANIMAFDKDRVRNTHFAAVFDCAPGKLMEVE